MNIIQEGFSQIFIQFIRIFQVLYDEGQTLWLFFSTPLGESNSEIVDLLPELAEYAPFEIMFGVGLIYVLIFGLVKFFFGILS